MPDTAKPSNGVIVLAGLLCLAIFPLWLFQCVGLANLTGSDAAGNAMSQGFTGLAIIALWVLLGGLMILAATAGGAPWSSSIFGFVLVPASCFVALAALDLLSHPRDAPYFWPILIPALIPPVIETYCIWALSPTLIAKISPPNAAAFAWGAVLLLCLAIVPMGYVRDQVIDKREAARAKYDADYAKLPLGAPLWDVTPFLDTLDSTKQAAVLERIRGMDRRQSDAEIMLDRGDFPLLYLGSMDLDPTSAICEKARALLRKRMAPLVLATPQSKPYRDIMFEVSDAVAAMNWLVGYECKCDAESIAWETMAKTYRDPNFDVYRLAELRDPKIFGRLLLQYPARFSMLSPRSHLKAWLDYADKPEYRERAIAGAHALDHRTADAVEMLNNKLDISAPWKVLQYMPVLDLEATVPLCEAGLTQVRGDLTKVYRPGAGDEPRPYRELLQRLGAYDPLTALKWLAGHGCDAEAELSQAEEVVSAYQDSLERVAMLASLARLHHKK